jgi:hypothetical protein
MDCISEVVPFFGAGFRRIEIPDLQEWQTEHHCRVLNHMPWASRRLFFWVKSDPLKVCRKVESQLIKGDDNLPMVMFNRPELA